MKKLILCGLVALGLVAGGCGAEPSPELVNRTGSLGQSTCCGVYDDLITYAKDCSPRLESLSGGPVVFEPLFPGASCPSRLAHYYLATPTGATTPSPTDVRSYLGTVVPGLEVSVAPDYLGVVPQGKMADERWEDDYRRMLFHTEALDLRGLPSSAAEVVVVDTLSGSASDHQALGADPEEHGFTLARVIEELTCAGSVGGCSVTTRGAWALSPDRHGAAPAGSFSGLARGIQCAFEAAPGCTSTPLGSTPPVVNLSLGWENPAMGGGMGGDIFAEPSEVPGAAAVHEILEYARCKGAAIFAAAGNAVGPNSTGFIYPAAWEGVGPYAPVRTLCAQFGVTPPGGTLAGFRPSLVTAVGAVGASEVPLAISRPGGTPRLVAYGQASAARAQLGVRAPGTGDDRAAVLSGTSVSTAVVSAATALLLKLGCTTDPLRAERFVRNNAAATTLPTAGNWVARRVSIASIVASALSTGACQAARYVRRHPQARSGTLGDCALMSSTSCPSLVATATLLPQSACGGGGNGSSSPACEARVARSAMMEPSLFPQPMGTGGEDPTISMLSEGSYVLKLDLAEGFHAVLVRLLTESGVEVDFALEPELEPGVIHAFDIDIGPGDPIAAAKLFFFVDGSDDVFTQEVTVE